MKRILATIVATFLLASVAGAGYPQSTWAAIVPLNNLPPARVVENTRAELLAKGCAEAAVTDDAVAADVPPGKPYRVAASDRIAGTYFFCDPTTVNQFTLRVGQVKAAEAHAQNPVQVGLAVAGVGFPPLQAANATIAAGKALGTGAGRVAVKALENSLLLVSGVGVHVLNYAQKLLQFTLTPGTFITNPLVTSAWPFVLGIANLGFIIALLFIAFATTLRLDLGGGVQRTLPRLLFAAILINFSLIIGGVLIDLSRIFMTIITGSLAGGSIEALVSKINAGSGLAEYIASVLTGLTPQGLTLTLALPANISALTQEALTAILIWGMALGFVVLAISLLVRYIALIILLILSPLAYLALAFPGQGNIASMWWKQFLKYVFYGPIALLLLIIAAHTGNIASDVASRFSGGNFTHIVTLCVTIGMLYAAAFSGRYMGVALSGATASFMTGKGKQLGRKLGGGAARLGLRAGVGGAKLGTDFIGRKTGFQPIKTTRDLLDKRKQYLEKEEKKRKKESWGSTVGDRIYQSAETKKQTARARQIAPTLGNNPALWDPTIINPTALRKGNVTDALGTENVINNVVLNTKDKNDIQALTQNPDFIKSLDGAQQTAFVQNIKNNTEIQAMPSRAELAADPAQAARAAAMTAVEQRQYDQRKEEKDREARERLITAALEAFRRADEAKT